MMGPDYERGHGRCIGMYDEQNRTDDRSQTRKSVADARGASKTRAIGLTPGQDCSPSKPRRRELPANLWEPVRRSRSPLIVDRIQIRCRREIIVFEAVFSQTDGTAMSPCVGRSYSQPIQAGLSVVKLRRAQLQ